MKEIVNELIKKHKKYVPIILKLNAKTITDIYNMSDEDAEEKLRQLEKIEIEKMESKKVVNQYLFYSNY